eukprot:3328597-Alexandrium_andersonii.AAC.1
MSASLVGSEMCIRDSFWGALPSTVEEARGAAEEARGARGPERGARLLRACSTVGEGSLRA